MRLSGPTSEVMHSELVVERCLYHSFIPMKWLALPPEMSKIKTDTLALCKYRSEVDSDHS